MLNMRANALIAVLLVAALLVAGCAGQKTQAPVPAVETSIASEANDIAADLGDFQQSEADLTPEDLDMEVGL